MSNLLDIKLLRSWEEHFGLEPCQFTYVHPEQVECTYKKRYKLLGYCFADNTLYFECEVNENAIVHECLHRVHPSWKGPIGEFFVRLVTRFILFREAAKKPRAAPK